MKATDDMVERQVTLVTDGHVSLPRSGGDSGWTSGVEIPVT